MSCVMCQGNLVAGTRPKALEREGRLAVVRDVPVEICESCGEVSLNAAVARQLDVVFQRLLDGPVDQVVGHYDSTAT